VSRLSVFTPQGSELKKGNGFLTLLYSGNYLQGGLIEKEKLLNIK
jgi:hypothetical protein